MADTLEIAIPKDLENLLLPDPTLLQYYVDAQDRHYWIDFDIDETLLSVSRDIINFNRLDKGIDPAKRKPVVLWIFSYGGSMDACYNLLDVCALSKTPIITINAGVAMSAGLLILLAGHKRYTLQMATALIHSGSSVSGGTYEQQEASMENYRKAVEKMRVFILDRTGMDAKVFNKNKNKDWFLDSTQQVQYSIAHEILSDIDIVI